MSDIDAMLAPRSIDPRALRGMSTTAQTREEQTPEQRRERWNRVIELLCLGEPPTRIARALGVHYNRVRSIMQNPEFQVELKTASEETHRRVMEQYKNAKERIGDKLEEITDLALDELEALVTGAESEKTKLAAIDSTLDRNPLTSRHSVSTPSGAGPAPAQLAVFLQIAATTARELDTKSASTNDAVTVAPTDVEIQPVS